MKGLSDYKALKLDLTRAGASFEVSFSKSSIRVKNEYDSKVYMFYLTDDGYSDLETINRVLTDAKNYLKKNEIAPVDESKIKWAQCFNDRVANFLQNDFEKVWVAQTDIRSAYWTFARKQGIISEKTHSALLNKYMPKHDELLQLQFMLATGLSKECEYDASLHAKIAKNVKKYKQSRLKALGSLASNRSFQVYRNNGGGLSVLDVEESLERTNKHRIKKAGTRNLYMHICNSVANFMEKVSIETGAWGYYWDCFFTFVNPKKEYSGLKSVDLQLFKQNNEMIASQHAINLHELNNKILAGGFDCAIDLGYLTEFSVEENYFMIDTKIENIHLMKNGKFRDLPFLETSAQKRYPISRTGMF